MEFYKQHLGVEAGKQNCDQMVFGAEPLVAETSRGGLVLFLYKKLKRLSGILARINPLVLMGSLGFFSS